MSQYLETGRLHQDHHETIRQRIARGLLDALGLSDETRRRIEEADNVTARITISLDGRKRGVTPEELTPIAESIADEDDRDGIDVVTKSGHRIRGKDLVLKKRVDIESFGSTVDHRHAWYEMDIYLRELEAQGALEQ